MHLWPFCPDTVVAAVLHRPSPGVRKQARTSSIEGFGRGKPYLLIFFNAHNLRIQPKQARTTGSEAPWALCRSTATIQLTPTQLN
jgi:hypothetical protein